MSAPPPNTQLLVSGSGAVYMQNLAVQGNSIIATNTDGSVNFVPNGNGVIGFGDVGFNSGVISTTVTDLDIVLTPDGNGTVKTGNLQLTGNTISSTDTDGDLLLAPNGNGNVGVGTTSPATRLHIYKSEDTTSVIYPLRIEAGTDGSNVSDGNSGVGMEFVANRGNNNQQLASQIYSQVYSGAGTSGDHWSLKFDVRADNILYNAMVIAANGGYANPGANVGIGTSSPAAKLDIGGNTDGQVQAILTRGVDTDFQLQAINESSSNNTGDIVSKFGVRHGTNETALFNFIRGNVSNDGSLAIVTNNTERMRVDSGGNVGIGTTDPLGTLDVNGVLHLRSGTTGYIGSSVDTTNKTNTYISFGESGTLNDWCYLRQIGGSNNYQLTFDFHDDGTDAGFFIRDVKSTDTPDTITTRFCVTGGNVGIGASSPRTRFQVNSPADLFYINSTSGQSVEIYGSASGVSPSYTASSDHSATVMINSTDAYSQNVGASISLGGRSYPHGGGAQPHTVYARMSGVQQPGTDSYYGNFVVETLYQNTGGLREALRIDGNGNVGIGTVSPAAKLDVAGTIRHQGLTLNEGTTPNVDEIKTFIKTLSVSTSWTDTGIIGSDLETGSYIIQVFSHNWQLGQYHSTFTGFISWYNTVTNSNYYNDVILHSVGNAISNVLYIRTQLLLGNTNTLKLQIRLSAGSGSGYFAFRFRRMI